MTKLQDQIIQTVAQGLAEPVRSYKNRIAPPRVSDTLSELKNVLSKLFNIRADKITEATPLAGLDRSALRDAVESVFGLDEIGFQMGEVHTLGDLRDIIDAHL